MSRNVTVDLGAVIVTIIVWVATWQLIKIMADKLDEKTRIFVYVTVIIISLFILYWLFKEQEEMDEE